MVLLGQEMEPQFSRPLWMCTDIYADNYNSDATADDGSCAGYPENGNYNLSFDGNSSSVNTDIKKALIMNSHYLLGLS